MRAPAPDGRRPGDVAVIRDWLVEGLHGEVGRALADWEWLAMQAGKPAPTSVAVELSGLEEAKLFWVPPEETEVIADAATDLPESLVLYEDMLPSVSGFVVFGGDWYGTDAMTNRKSIWPIRAFRWGPVNLPDKCGPDGLATDDAVFRPGIAISAYSFSLDMKDSALANLPPEELKARMGQLADDLSVVGFDDGWPQEASFWVQKGMEDLKPSWMPLGRSDWMIDQPWTEHPVFGRDHAAYRSVLEDRCIMAALWALMASCKPVEHVPNRAERRQACRRGHTAAPVRIVTWRGPQGQRPVTAAEAEATRHLTKRQYIEKFWRNQPYGPRNSLRRWQLIPGYWRGPEDAPLADPRTTIHKVVKR